MISFWLGNKEYSLPNAWEELTREQYMFLVPLLHRMTSNELSLCQVRVKWLLQVMGLDKVIVRPNQEELFTDNIYTLSRQVTFFWYAYYGDAVADLSPDVRRMVRKTLSEDIVSPDPELRYVQQLEYAVQVDAVWAKNLIPEIAVGRNSFPGWSARLDSGMLITTMTTRQFTQGYDMLISLTSVYSLSTMILLTALLYGVSLDDRQALARMEVLDNDLLQAIVLNFQAFVSFIFMKTHFSILWNRDQPARPTRKVSMSMSEGVYALCNKGYGNYDQVEQMPLMTYLSIMRTDLIASIRSMHDTGSKPEEIAEHTNLPYDLITQLL